MSNVNTIYYFQIGDADADEAGCFVGMQGNVVCVDNEIHKLRAFTSRRLADQFFATMNGRYVACVCACVLLRFAADRNRTAPAVRPGRHRGSRPLRRRGVPRSPGNN